MSTSSEGEDTYSDGFTCERCRYWRPKGPNLKRFRSGATFGWCYRYPPQLVALDGGTEVHRPYIHKDEWCGAYRSCQNPSDSARLHKAMDDGCTDGAVCP